MAVSTQQEFLDVLGRSNLLTDEQLRAAGEVADVSDEPRAIAKRIVQEGWLTRWQAQQLLAGRAKLFLGKYKLLAGIGQGGMGTVLKAEHPGLNRIVALKVMSREVLGNPDAVARFVREIQLAAALDHPHIVRAYDADRVGKTYFLVMESTTFGLRSTTSQGTSGSVTAHRPEHQRVSISLSCLTNLHSTAEWTSGFLAYDGRHQRSSRLLKRHNRFRRTRRGWDSSIR